MKHYAHIIIYLVCLASAWLMYGCRSTYQSNSRAKEQRILSISDSALRIRTEDVYSRFHLNQKEEGKGWKIKVNFDTSLPADSETGLPPISDIEIEGSETNIKTVLQKDDTTHVSDTQETKNDISLHQHKQLDTTSDAGASVATGIDDGIKYGMIIGIPAVLILIIISYVRQKNSSK